MVSLAGDGGRRDDADVIESYRVCHMAAIAAFTRGYLLRTCNPHNSTETEPKKDCKAEDLVLNFSVFVRSSPTL
jgi:hypothetical protein